MNRIRLLTLASAAAVIALIAAGCGSSSSGGSSSAGAASSSASSSATVAAKRTSLGTILTDGSGRTLYLFEKDKGPKSTCSGACASNWPPFTAASKPSVSGGASSSDIKLSKRGDGQMQVTYNGHPLYYYTGDQSAGQMNGQGINAFGAPWYVLTAQGTKVTSKPSSSSGNSSSKSGGGYGGY